jgi:hypothetical protein
MPRKHPGRERGEFSLSLQIMEEDMEMMEDDLYIMEDDLKLIEDNLEIMEDDLEIKNKKGPFQGRTTLGNLQKVMTQNLPEIVKKSEILI